MPLHAQAAAQQATAPAKAAPEKFYITAFDVSGATQLDRDAIETTVYDFAGPDRSAADVESARKALEDLYKARGFEAVQVDIPPQPEALFAQGVVQLHVTEAPIGQVNVTGSRHHSVKVVRAEVPSVTEGKVLNTRELQSDLAGANRFPDRTVTPSFKPGAVPGTVDVDLAVEDSLPLHGSLELTNDHSPSTEPLRVNASLRYTNLWQRGHSISGTYIVAPQDRHQTEVFSGSYSAPLIGTPWTFVLYGVTSNSNVAALGGTNVLGNGFQIGARAVYRLSKDSSSVVQNITFGLDYKNFEQNISVAGQAAEFQPIEYTPLFLGYGLSTGSDKTNFDANVSVTAGFRVIKKFGCFEVNQATCNATTVTDQFKNHDFLSNENFVHANFDLSLRHAWKGDFQTTLKLYGQLADSHLVTNEQFGIGGLATLRGYLQSEAVGDDGYAVMLEAATPSLAPHLPDFVDEMRLFGFFERGGTRIVAAPEGQNRGQALMSAGGGVRLKLFKHLSGDLVVGVPLKGSLQTREGDVRTTFSARGEF